MQEEIKSTIPISAMVVGYNESRFLKQCLESISFCDEIVYTDLGSTDDSVAIAQQYCKTVYHRNLVPSCEMIQAEVVNYLEHDWVIFIDPDERVSENLAKEIKARFADFQKDPQLGGVLVPWQFYFLKKKLKGTVWGGINQKYFLVYRRLFLFEPIVHYGRKLAVGAKSETIVYNNNFNILEHYWMNSIAVFVRKHLRYLKNEGIDRYNQGNRSGYKRMLITPWKQFYFSFITKQGYKDWFTGFGLSVFWAVYETYICIDLLKIQAEKKHA